MHIITSILVPYLLIAEAAIFFVPKKGILPQAPRNLVNVAALLAHGEPLLKALRGMGAADMRRLVSVSRTHSTRLQRHRPI